MPFTSSVRRSRPAIFGWKDDGKYYLSIAPRIQNLAANQYETAIEALKDASKRSVAIVWEDPSVI